MSIYIHKYVNIHMCVCVYIYRHTALRQPGSRQTPAAISTLPAKILASSVLYKKEPRILGEMADSRAGAGKALSEPGTPPATRLVQFRSVQSLSRVLLCATP